MQRFEGKVVVIAGGATGIGAESARRLASEGASVVIGDIDLESARATAAGIVEAGGTAMAARFDLTDESSVAALIQTGVEAFGGIDCLFNNGADVRRQTLDADTDALTIDIDHFDYVLRVDLRGYLLTCRYGIPHMLRRGGGSIVCTSADAGFMLHPEGKDVAYSAAKLGVVALVRHVLARWGQEGIRCNCISPGPVTTETFYREANRIYGADFDLAAVAKSNPSGHVCSPADVAGTVAFLLSSDAAGINGQVIHVNGGATVTM